MRDAHRALGRVDLVQQGHDLFAEAERSGVAGRGRAGRQAQEAAETQQGCELHGSELEQTRVRARWRAGPALGAEVEWARGGGRGKGATMTRLKAAGKHACFGSSTFQEMGFFFLLRLLPALQNLPLHNSDMPAAAKGELYIYFNQRLNCCRFQ